MCTCVQLLKVQAPNQPPEYTSKLNLAHKLAHFREERKLFLLKFKQLYINMNMDCDSSSMRVCAPRLTSGDSKGEEEGGGG